ncbi:MAG: alpha/beta fold hydrolase [Luteitalea sp.]|nr:alpha/beta fold hydrolase [Luteitalea sp.]
MNRHLPLSQIIVAAMLLMSGPARAQDSTTIDRAKQVMDAIVKGQFEAVTEEFDAQMAAALPAQKLQEVWKTLLQQTGAFKSIIDERSQTAAGGITAVTLACQCERGVLNALVAFDVEARIAGLRFVPRPVAAAPAVSPPPGSRFSEQPVTVGTGPFALPGTLSVPTDRVVAAMVLVHGSGPHDRDGTVGPNTPLRDLAWGLANRQIAVLRYEKRTREHGAKVASIPNLTVQVAVIDDALAAVVVLKTHTALNARPVFVLGHSLGGTLAPRIARADPDIAGVVIMAGAALPFWDVARRQLVYLASLQPGSGAISVDDGLATLRRAAPESYWKDLEAYRPLDVAASLKIPVLVLQGERDYQVTTDNFAAWQEALGDRTATFKLYPTLNHLFLPGEGKSTPAEYQRAGHIPDAVIDDIATWLKARVN